LSSAQQPPSASLKDGRKNSEGETVTSPVESWKPNLARQQSWNQQDLKRELQLSSMDGSGGGGGKKEKDGGFSETGGK